MKKAYQKPTIEVIDFEAEKIMGPLDNEEEFISGLPEGWE